MLLYVAPLPRRRRFLPRAHRSPRARAPAPRAARRAQDPIDGLCLTSRGFAACDTTTLWTVGVAAGRQSLVSFFAPHEEAQCLERVQTGKYDSRVRLASCKASNTLKWNIKSTLAGAMVTSDDGKQCIGRQGNFASMQLCEFGYTALAIIGSNLHQRGFLITTRDGTCFDGLRFRTCDPKDYTLYWGAAVRFDSPKGEVRARARAPPADASRALRATTPFTPLRPRARCPLRARRATTPCSSSTNCAPSRGRSASRASRASAARPPSSPTAHTGAPSRGPLSRGD
jgi:hypothetical protein